MTIYAIVEHDQQTIRASTYNMLAAAAQLKQEVYAVVIGHDCAQVAEQVAKVKVVSKVLLLAHETYQHVLAERWCEAILSIMQQPKYVLAPATTFGKNFLPRVAAQLRVAQLSDVITIVDARTFKRPIYAGNAIATMRVSAADPICLTIRTTAFAPLLPDEQYQAPIEQVDFVATNRQSQFVTRECQRSDRPELASAEIVVSGGRGLQTKEQFARLAQIADRLGAAIGASRAAVDGGLASNDLQVGQTGQVVAPKLYFALGISGAIQHLAGMKDSQIIVAINKDPDAPIFQCADYGLVADLNSVLPEWEAVLTEMGY